jgi:hypothetical protein
MVFLAVWGVLRFGELAGLTRSDLDLEIRTVRVVRQVVELSSGRQVVGPPKTEAGCRTVALPPHVEDHSRRPRTQEDLARRLGGPLDSRDPRLKETPVSFASWRQTRRAPEIATGACETPA